MKYTVVTFVIFILPLSMLAQDINSQWDTWNDQGLEDSVRLKALGMIADVIVKDYPDSANILADTMLQMANKTGLKRLKAEALRIKGDCFENLYAYEKAIEYYKLGLSIVEEMVLQPEMIVLYYKIGYAYLKQYEYPKTIEYYQKGLILGKEIGDKAATAKGYMNMGIYYYYTGNFTESLNNFESALALYQEIGDEEETADMYTRVGAIYYHLGNYPKAIKLTNKYFEYEKGAKNLRKHGEIYTNLGAIYFQQKDYLKAMEFYKKGLALDSTFSEPRGIAIGYYNIGECFLELKDYDKAFEYMEKCISLGLEYKEKDLLADCYLKIGLIKQIRGAYEEAGSYYSRSLEVANEIGYTSILSSINTQQGSLLNILNNHNRAVNYCLEGLRLSKESGDMIQQIDACKCLYESYKSLGNASKALEYHEVFLVLSDSLQRNETIRQLEKMEYDQQMVTDSIKMEEEKLIAQLASEKEISKQKSRKNIFLFIGISVFVIAIGLYSRLSYIRKSRAIIQKEKDISENLLLNILPSEVAEELKLNGESVARSYENVTVLFTDFEGFTSLSENLNAQELVAEINTCFKAFDQIITSYGMEKIKTIGDAYMAVGGLHDKKASSVKDVVLASLDMQAFMEGRKLELQSKKIPFFEMRLGIHTGQVVAGIVGVKKFQYDIWGDTVNIANRMESSGKTGKVNISESTYLQVKDDPDFSFESRGNIEAKNKGKLKMYFVERI